MTSRRIDILARDTVFDGYFQVERYSLKHELHNGGTSEVLSREVFERGHVAALLPVDPVTDKVVLIEQFRPGALAAGWDPWLLECVAGIIEDGEEAVDVAVRECHEETGLQARDCKLISRYLTSPGACSETVHLYAGKVDASIAGGVFGLADEGEDIKVVSVSVDDALHLVESGCIVNSKTIIALQWLALQRPNLQSFWA